MSRKDKDALKELATSFIQVLDNNDVVTKIATVLSTSINLIFEEKLNSVLSKLDKLLKDNKNYK
jgi:molecular chaperone GrpE (heat shock protein)